MAKKPEHDITAWRLARERSTTMQPTLNALNKEREKYADMYFMDQNTRPGYKANQDEAIVETISPEPNNKVKGATRLMTTTSPHFTLPKKSNTAGTDQKSDPLEKLANLMWTRSNIKQMKKIEREMAFMGFLFDEIHGQVVSTKKLLEATMQAEARATPELKKMWEGRRRQAEATAAYTPYLFEALNCMTGTGIRGRHGLSVYDRMVERKPLEVYLEWGERAYWLRNPSNPNIMIKYHEQWDEVYHFVWDEGHSDEPIYAEPHGLSFMPIEIIIPEGSDLFSTQVLRQREPLLYGVLKSGIWSSENVMLTAIMTNVNALINAGFVFRKGTEEDDVPEPVHTVIGYVTPIPPNASLGPMAKELVHPDSVKVLDMLREFMTNSTLYDQALGQPVSGADNYSLVSLLAQAGRLPLIGVKESLQLLTASLMQKAFIWLKEEGGYKTTTDDGSEINVKGEDIPSYLEWVSSVEPDLPQDKMQSARIADALSGGQNPTVSKRYVREEILNIGQSGEMQKEIWTEQAASLRANIEAEELVRALMERRKQKQTRAMGATPETHPTPPAGSRELGPEAVAPGQPMTGPVPPQGQGPVSPNGAEPQ